MTVLRSIGMAFSMFSRVPMPRMDWSERNMRYLLCGFPAVGLLVGLLLWLWGWLSAALGFGTPLYAAGLTLLPLFLTGGIHMDGFCDVADALASHAEPEKKRAILKDPHIGAFAAIGCGAYLLLYFALCAEVPPRALPLLAAAPVLSRALGGLAVLLVPPNKPEGLGRSFREAADRSRSVAVLAAVACLAAGWMLALDIARGLWMAPAALGAFLYVYWMSKKEFGGMSGDLAGYLVQIAEIAMLAALAAAEAVV